MLFGPSKRWNAGDIVKCHYRKQEMSLVWVHKQINQSIYIYVKLFQDRVSLPWSYLILSVFLGEEQLQIFSDIMHRWSSQENRSIINEKQLKKDLTGSPKITMIQLQQGISASWDISPSRVEHGLGWEAQVQAGSLLGAGTSYTPTCPSMKW